jgi:hypothetical protein
VILTSDAPVSLVILTSDAPVSLVILTSDAPVSLVILTSDAPVSLVILTSDVPVSLVILTSDAPVSLVIVTSDAPVSGRADAQAPSPALEAEGTRVRGLCRPHRAAPDAGARAVASQANRSHTQTCEYWRCRFGGAIC